MTMLRKSSNHQPDQEISDLELEELDRCLLEWANEEDDENFWNLSLLDGYLCAVISGPDLVMPSEWMAPIVDSLELSSEEDARHMMTLIMQLYNTRCEQLLNKPEHFYPLLEGYGEEPDIVEIPDDWCEGYMRLLNQHLDTWQPLFNSDAGTLLMLPIDVFADDRSMEIIKDGSDDWEHTRKELLERLPVSVAAIYQFWLEKRESPSISEPIIRKEHKVGRNEPCPCGSGKKFKKCCGDPLYTRH